jgi:hypothetical protein
LSISKKIRFEVFKRDGFACAYCGKTPPTVTLEIDHIEPKSRNGKDRIENLITACFDCNRGKSNIPLDKIPNKISENLEILKEQEDQLREYRKMVKKIEKRERDDINEIDSMYSSQYPGWSFSDNFKAISLKKFLSLLPKHKVKEAICIAIRKFPKDRDNVIKYFCGVCWTMIKNPEKYGC